MQACSTQRSTYQPEGVLTAAGCKDRGRGMRRTSIIRIIVALAAPPLLVSMLSRSEQSRLATEPVQTSQVAGYHAFELHSNAEQSLPDRASPPKTKLQSSFRRGRTFGRRRSGDHPR